jgi:predicted enzyme related to lactoylglutathione lyase
MSLGGDMLFGMPRVMHFEIPSDEPEKSMAFYQNVFGWEFSQFGDQAYWLCKTGEGEPGIDGGLMKRQHRGQPVANTIVVDSVDEYCEKIAAAGGQIVVPKMPIGDIGFLAYFTDPDGNIFGVGEFKS